MDKFTQSAKENINSHSNGRSIVHVVRELRIFAIIVVIVTIFINQSVRVKCTFQSRNAGDVLIIKNKKIPSQFTSYNCCTTVVERGLSVSCRYKKMSLRFQSNFLVRFFLNPPHYIRIYVSTLSGIIIIFFHLVYKIHVQTYVWRIYNNNYHNNNVCKLIKQNIKISVATRID